MSRTPKTIKEIQENSTELYRILGSDDPVGMYPTVMDNLTYSYIGSSVITYVLGVSNRHMDNILITKEGNYLHIDFGYIFGSQPPNKGNSAEMHYIKVISNTILSYAEKVKCMTKEGFLEEFHKVYAVLRRNANFIVGLFKVMNDTGLFKFCEPAVGFLKKRLAIGKTDDEASNQMEDTIYKSENSFFDPLYDLFHNIK